MESQAPAEQDNSLEVIADLSTPSLDNPPAVTEFRDPYLDGGDVAFIVRQTGVYVDNGTALEV